MDIFLTLSNPRMIYNHRGKTIYFTHADFFSRFTELLSLFLSNAMVQSLAQLLYFLILFLSIYKKQCKSGANISTLTPSLSHKNKNYRPCVSMLALNSKRYLMRTITFEKWYQILITTAYLLSFCKVIVTILGPMLNKLFQSILTQKIY